MWEVHGYYFSFNRIIKCYLVTTFSLTSPLSLFPQDEITRALALSKPGGSVTTAFSAFPSPQLTKVSKAKHMQGLHLLWTHILRMQLFKEQF